MKPKLKAPGTKRLKLKYGEPLSTSCLKFNLRCYTKDSPAARAADAQRWINEWRWTRAGQAATAIDGDDEWSVDTIDSLDFSRRRSSPSDVMMTEPTVLVRPGVYAENVRVTKTCALIGWGPPGAVAIEGVGWEPALVFAGLGNAARAKVRPAR